MDGKTFHFGDVRLKIYTRRPNRPTQSASHLGPSNSCVGDIIMGGLAAGRCLGRQLMRKYGG